MTPFTQQATKKEAHGPAQTSNDNADGPLNDYVSGTGMTGGGSSTSNRSDGLPEDGRSILLNSNNWDNLDKLAIWLFYEADLRVQGYHIMGSSFYKTLGKGDFNVPPAALDPFHPTDLESFVHHFHPRDLLSTRTSSTWQPGVDICFGIDRFQRQVVMKAVPNDTPELAVLRQFSCPPLCADKRNRVIPVLDFVATKHDFVIVVMPAWGMCWQLPPCGNMTTRVELAIKLAECLQLLHECGVGHGDIQPFNILINHVDSRNFSETSHNDFRQSHNIEYTYIDFGSAFLFPPGTSCVGCPRTIPPDNISSPEQQLAMESEAIPVDLFAADVYNFGKTLEGELCAAFEAYGEAHIPDPKEYKCILREMTNEEPLQRPSAAAVLKFLLTIR
ncbi:hypothetical protein R3P38DRAFT_3133106 [Favolaschia claudopus]|uniref:Protein kinase domain-containing protein n=1 Tax=Favolaschia claudopus TaxID=2862362 RepID=A0AAV9Z854_9AGAR